MQNRLKRGSLIFIAASFIIGIPSAFLTGEQPKQVAAGLVINDEPEQAKSDKRPWNSEGVHFVPEASYDLKCRVLHRERYWTDEAARFAPLDLAVAWGRASDSAVVDKMTVTQGNRHFQLNATRVPLPGMEMVTHNANVHCVPATPEIREKLLRVQINDFVELKGYLVNASWRQRGIVQRLTGSAGDLKSWETSTRRDDVGDGSCEILWIESIEVIQPEPYEPQFRLGPGGIYYQS